MPLWCAADHSHEEGGETALSTPLKARSDRPKQSRKKGHSRVVRISPGDSVVLNSAERAPFLLHVEILDGDLDFDPTRRENRELLKKIVVQEDMKRRKKESGLDVPGLVKERFGSPMPDAVPPTPELDERKPQERRLPFASSSRKEVRPEEMEEMDLVEQLYGAKLSVRDALPDLSESIPLPTVRNKQLDVAAWDRASEGQSRRGSITPSTPHPIIEAEDEITRSATPTNGLLGTSNHNSTPSTPGIPNKGAASPKHTITLEDYAERMRTAAVMLAQLNASLVPAVPETNQPQAKSSWIPGTGWITGSNSKDTTDQLHQSAGGKLKLAAAQAAAIRERIMEEMMALEEERVERMTERPEGVGIEVGEEGGRSVEDEGIVRRELNKADPSGGSFLHGGSCVGKC